jgi:probable O-glycosylation ligase (exosortase A-associated)
MKQLLFMLAMTFAGTAGAFVVNPFWGVTVYYLFAVLRPQYLWVWALPPNVPWSWYVGVATLIAAAAVRLGMLAVADSSGFARKPQAGRFTLAHRAVMLFGLWVGVTYFMARDQEVAYPWMIEYLKIFAMYAASTLLIRTTNEVWKLYVVSALALGYIGYEVNFAYLVHGHLGIYFNGYGGLDNNGAGLMLAMGVPMCFFAWEGTTRIWRWGFAALVPVLIHAALMTFSRGAMVALLVAVPLFIVRSRRRGQLALAIVALAMIVPILAGREIRDEFFSVEKYETESSARLRFGSWDAGWRMAKDNPIFGVGVRNSPLFSAEYGADMHGRVIHSQLLQIAADSGFVGLGFYLIALWTVWRALRRTMVYLKRTTTRTEKDDEEEHRRAYAAAAGIESSLAVFLVGSLFLSLEVFELPYVLLLLGAQLPVVLGVTRPDRVVGRAASPAQRPASSGAFGGFTPAPTVGVKVAARR